MAINTILQPPTPNDPRARLDWWQCYGNSSSLAIAAAASQQTTPVIVITPDFFSATRVEYECRFFLGKQCDVSIMSFPDWETLPYDTFSPHQDIISQRLSTLYRLPTMSTGIVIIPITTLMQRLTPADFIAQHALIIAKGDKFDLDQTRQQLTAAGYYQASQVMAHGEYAVRGSIIDIFPMGSQIPFRIDCFDDEIDSIRSFDVDTQRSLDKFTSIELLPAHEFPTNETAISTFRSNWRSQFNGDPRQALIYRDVSEGIFSAGMEYYLPLFFENTATFFDYLPNNSLLITLENCYPAAEKYWQDINHRYDQRAHDISRPILPPSQLFLPPNELMAALKQWRRINVNTEKNELRDHLPHFPSEPPPGLQINNKAAEPLQAVNDYIKNQSKRILFCAESEGRREILLELLSTINIKPKFVECWQDFINSDITLAITTAPLDHGLVLSEPNIAIIVEAQLFSQQIMQRRRRKKQAHDPDNVVRDLAELHVGTPVVHLEHGVGRYLGLQTLAVGEINTEFLTIEYGGGDKLYVPVSSLHLISRYSGNDVEHAPLHRLGTDQWQKAKRKALERARDVAAELLDIYAKRQARQGFQFSKPDEDYLKFATEFSFEETPDQEQAIADVISDMTNNQPMDRLICGDVGFGKTEVALRAAFIAANSGKQVAMLVPTTLLAQQHYQNFIDRFAHWPIRIEVLSRFKTAKEQTKILEDLSQHQVDILIGTHKLLQNNIKFKQLGLLIIDEEHRFGVRQKERLKALRAEVDILTLTATPIPRTLNMAMSGLRELSIIATPPAKRLSIKTFIHQQDNHIIREAILREIMRGGQVYYLHNKVDTIAKVANDIAELVPEARVNFGHGQMRERELEQLMSDFYHLRFNVLVCTTIIETGIDVPTANTIIIDRADRFGLAQLHQLRGRVGRSHHQAYAYLLRPPEKLITSDAKKRLQAITALEDLGVGFSLATHDLEIRGAGELLGEEQSGHIQEIGFSLYMELLERAIDSLRRGETLDIDKPLNTGTEIDLQIAALIPHDYLPDVHARLMLYKRMANAKSDDALDDLQVEMIDRFGLLPEAVKNLFAITSLKLIAEKIGIIKIEAGMSSGRLDFTEKPHIDPMTIIKLIQVQPKTYKFDGKTRLRFYTETESAEQRLAFIRSLMEKLIS